MFCTNCGQPIDAGMRFCPNCGQEIAVSVTPVVAAANQVDLNASRNDYSLLLLSTGTCSATVARELIADLLGYTESQAKELIRVAPVEIACSLNAQQAVTLSQALTEMGLQVSIRNANGYVDFNQTAANSVFEENGSVLKDVMNILGTLTLANRVRRATRWTLDDPFRFIFAPRYRRPAAPRYARHFRRAPVVVVRPAPRKVVKVAPPRPSLRMAPLPRAASPRPAARPAPARPAGLSPRPAPRPAVPGRSAPGPMPRGPFGGPKPGPGGRGSGRGPGRP